MERLGLGYENLKAVNPKLIYGVLTPFGKEGPWKDCPDYDLIVMAKCGLLEKTGFPTGLHLCKLASHSRNDGCISESRRERRGQ